MPDVVVIVRWTEPIERSAQSTRVCTHSLKVQPISNFKFWQVNLTHLIERVTTCPPKYGLRGGTSFVHALEVTSNVRVARTNICLGPCNFFTPHLQHFGGIRMEAIELRHGQANMDAVAYEIRSLRSVVSMVKLCATDTNSLCSQCCWKKSSCEKKICWHVK